MSFEEPTQRVRRPDAAAEAPTTALPGPLNLAEESPRDASGTTDVLSLDELFDGQTPSTEPAGSTEPAHRATVDEAPTWTAMPVVSVRSEPVAMPDRDATPAAPAGTTPAPLGGRVRSDATAAWEAAVRRTRAWLAHDDNGLTLATALVAVILIIAIAGLS